MPVNRHNDIISRRVAMNKTFRVLILSLLCTTLFGTSSATSAQYSKVSREQLFNELNNPRLTIVDLRENQYWKESGFKIKKAVRLNPDSPDFKSLKRGGTVVLYCVCPDERQSAALTQQFIDNGFEYTYVLSGGWNSWIDARYPVERK